MLDAKTKHEP